TLYVGQWVSVNENHVSDLALLDRSQVAVEADQFRRPPRRDTHSCPRRDTSLYHQAELDAVLAGLRAHPIVGSEPYLDIMDDGFRDHLAPGVERTFYTTNHVGVEA